MNGIVAVAAFASLWPPPIAADPPNAGVTVEATGRLAYLKSLREAPEGLYRVEIGGAAVYLTFADPATRTAAHKLVGQPVTVRGTLALGVLEKRGAMRPEGDAVVAATEVAPAAVVLDPVPAVEPGEGGGEGRVGWPVPSRVTLVPAAWPHKLPGLLYEF